MQPQAPNPNYNFIMQNGQPAKRGLKLPGAGLPKIALWSILGLFGIAVIIIIFSLLTGGGQGNTQAYVNAVARSQEIIRVSTSVVDLATDAQTQNLAATTESTLTNEQAQLKTYLKSQKIVVTNLALNADKNAGTDTDMQTAVTNGNLNTVYASYLKTQLQTYSTDLHAAYDGAGAHGQAILKTAYDSVQVLLQSPQIAKS